MEIEKTIKLSHFHLLPSPNSFFPLLSLILFPLSLSLSLFLLMIKTSKKINFMFPPPQLTEFGWHIHISWLVKRWMDAEKEEKCETQSSRWPHRKWHQRNRFTSATPSLSKRMTTSQVATHTQSPLNGVQLLSHSHYCH